jgi:RimJ/RimL family protein N-acetyltransferase
MPQKISHNTPELNEYSIHLWPACSIRRDGLAYRDQIIKKSRQAHVAEWEPDDMNGRFADADSFSRWASQGRAIVGLIKEDEVFGITYFGPKKVPDGYILGSTTVGLRLYEGAVGRGIAKPFFVAAHMAVEGYVDVSDVWLTVREENVAAIATYKAAGYQKQGLSDEGLHVMRYDRR